MMVPAAIHIQLVEILDNRLERMAGAFVADFRHDTPHHFLLSELRRVKGATIGFYHRPYFLNHVHRLALSERNKSLQGIDIRTVPRLHCPFNIPFRNRRVFLADPREPKRLTVSRRDSVP